MNCTLETLVSILLTIYEKINMLPISEEMKKQLQENLKLYILNGIEQISTYLLNEIDFEKLQKSDFDDILICLFCILPEYKVHLLKEKSINTKLNTNYLLNKSLHDELYKVYIMFFPFKPFLKNNKVIKNNEIIVENNSTLKVYKETFGNEGNNLFCNRFHMPGTHTNELLNLNLEEKEVMTNKINDLNKKLETYGICKSSYFELNTYIK